MPLLDPSLPSSTAEASPLHALASSGALVDGLKDELDGWRRDDTPVEVEPWLDALDEYLDSRDDPNPVDGWHQLWPTGPEREDDEPDEPERPPYSSPACAIGRTALTATLPAEQADDGAEVRHALFERISAADVTTLGEIATVQTPDQEDEPDDFPWVDAATWTPAEVARSNYDEARYPPDELDDLFGEQPDEEVGSVDELGWYGLVKHEDKPGGLILIQDEQGFRHVREAPDDEALAIQWATIQSEYETFYSQRDAYELAAAGPGSTTSGYSPRIWVGSLADYNNGNLHGVWMDATLEPDELHAAVQFMLRTSDAPGAEEWSIFDHDNFGGYEVSEWSSFDTVSLIAQGIAEHGEAYAAWVNHVGDTSGELLEPERFRDHYHGDWDSAEEYAEHYLTETESYAFMQFVPDSIRHYVSVDVETYARDMQSEGLLVVELSNGKVAVFWTR